MIASRKSVKLIFWEGISLLRVVIKEISLGSDAFYQVKTPGDLGNGENPLFHRLRDLVKTQIHQGKSPAHVVAELLPQVNLKNNLFAVTASQGNSKNYLAKSGFSQGKERGFFPRHGP